MAPELLNEDVCAKSELEEMGGFSEEVEVDGSSKDVEMSSSSLRGLILDSLLEIAVSVETVNVGSELDESQVS